MARPFASLVAGRQPLTNRRGSVTGSNNSRGFDSPGNSRVPTPIAEKDKKGKNKDKNLDQGDMPAPAPVGPITPDFYNPTDLATLPQTVAPYVPYNPMPDPAVLRALGYTA